MKHKITSDDARVLLGTIYLPVGTSPGRCQGAGGRPVGLYRHRGAVAGTRSGPNLVLNSDYDMTDVPVPAGIAGSSQVDPEQLMPVRLELLFPIARDCYNLFFRCRAALAWCG